MPPLVYSFLLVVLSSNNLRFIVFPDFGWDILMKEYYWHLRREVCSKVFKDTSTYSTHRSQVHADIPLPEGTYWVYAHTKLLVTLRLRRLCHNRAIQYGNSPHILLLYLSKNQIHIHTDTLVGLQSTSIHVQVYMNGRICKLAFFLILQKR